MARKVTTQKDTARQAKREHSREGMNPNEIMHHTKGEQPNEITLPADDNDDSNEIMHHT
ncbi:hypothetical protein CDS [Bradyrhizobium sp.]|uniref:hypothetical protein n=1 Tax=Bradyrhizobium sp. TaxID=376 RepID=UPI0007C1D5FA|nr:hypothetical protein [Bradyrhizobium sp.]CUU14760.1 hypothetical protein CDS [Bradyrhizobium sp.]